MRTRVKAGFILLTVCGLCRSAEDLNYDRPDRGEPGDVMIQNYLARQASALDATFLDGISNAADWNGERARYKKEFLSMLGLDPMPERTPLHPTVTRTVEGKGFVVENLHYQSRPGLYVTANLYRPQAIKTGERLPAILYVCGHSGMGRNGNKAAFQSHGIWFARHGYVCLVVDTLQLGEIPGVHHGTYREGRWWWHSRGYTSAGVECWNGIRGIDYLVGRPDVDPERIGVTGISGGGAVTYWVAGADDRVKVAVPVSGMADLVSYVDHRVVNGHCDCMFLYNTYRWPWTRIAGMIAPRPLLYINSDRDKIFPMDANDRVINRLERLYSYFEAGERVDAVVSNGGHAYRKDIQAAAYRFFNSYFKGDARLVTDADIDFVSEDGANRVFPIEPTQLRVFATDADIPVDHKNGTIDREFVPIAKVELPKAGEFDSWKSRMIGDLRRNSFRPFPERIPAARLIDRSPSGYDRLETEEGIVVNLRPHLGPSKPEGEAAKVYLLMSDSDAVGAGVSQDSIKDASSVYELLPRGVGPTKWTRKDPPNYVDRSHVLIGTTVDAGRVRDVIATARHVRARLGHKVSLIVGGKGASGVIAAYAALLEPEIDGVALWNPPSTHMDAAAPVFLNILRVLDIPEAVGLLAPRSLVIRGGADTLKSRVGEIYARAGAADRFESR